MEPQITEFKLQSIEDEVRLDRAFPERERGGIHKLIRAILHANEKVAVEITINKVFIPKSYYINPAALVQQLRTGTHEWMKAWRSGDDIHIRCTHEHFVNPVSWIGTLAERMMKLPEEGLAGREPYIDVPWAEVPVTYSSIVTRIAQRVNMYLQRCNYAAETQAKAYQNFLRIWLFRERKQSRSRLQKR